jgi:hypothetical protein
MGLTPAEKAVYLELVFNGGENGKSIGSVEKLRKAVGIAKVTCRNAIDALAELGLITRVTDPKLGGGSVSRYYVLDVDQWVQALDDSDGVSNDPSGVPTGQNSSGDGVSNDPSLEEINPSSKSLPKVGGRSRKVKRAEFLPGDSIPPEWIDEEFLAAWNDWALLRPTSSLSTGVITKNSKVLADSGSRANALAILAKSEQMGWRGLFPLNGKKGGTARDFDQSNEDIVNELLK